MRYFKLYIDSGMYRQPPTMTSGLMFVRKYFFMGLYMHGRAYRRTAFCVSHAVLADALKDYDERAFRKIITLQH